MSTNNNTYGHTYPELEKRILEKDAELKSKAIKEAKFLGMQNRPGVMDKLEPYIGFIKSGYEDLRAQVLQLIQPDMHDAKMRTNGTALEHKQTEIGSNIARLTHENTIAKHELDGKVPDMRHTSNWKGVVILALIYLGELVFNAWSFEFMGDSLLFSLFIAASITAGMYLFSRGIMYLIARAQNEGRKFYLGVAALAIPALALIAVLSSWRATMLGSTGETSVHPGIFAVVNLFLFIGSMLASYFFFPKKEEAQADRALRAKYEAILEREDKITGLKTEKDKLEDQAREQALHHQQIISLANHATARIATLYNETAEAFKSTLLAHRDDKLTPDCFCDPVPPLTPLTQNR